MFDMDDFVDIARMAGRVSIQDNHVRVTGSSITVGDEVVRRVRGEDPERAAIAIQYSPKHQALRFSKADEIHDGYTFVLAKGGGAKINNLPYFLKKLKVARGVYIQDTASPEIYVFDEAITLRETGPPEDREAKYVDESVAGETAAEGDIVSWAARKNSSIYIATGTVEKIDETYLHVRPLSQRYIAEHHATRMVRVERSNIIIREKSNVN